MAYDRPIIRLQTGGTAKVPYGRARLTVKRWGELSSGEVGKAVSGYERGEIDADALSWTFIRDRVESASPSFEWKKAELGRLVKLVASTSTEPQLSASDPKALAEELVAGAETEREQIREASAVTRELGTTVLGSARTSLGALSGYEKVMGAARRGLLYDFRKAQARRDSVLRKVTGLGIGRVTEAQERMRGILANNYGLPGNLAQIMGGGRFQTPPWAQLTGGQFQTSRWSQLMGSQFQTPRWFRELPKPGALLGAGDFGKIARSWAEAHKRALPANWRELERDELDPVVGLMLAEGLSLAWAPRDEIIRALVAAPDQAARSQILEARAAEIIEDIESALEGVYRQDLQPIVDAGREAIEAYRDNHPAPAQAYAASAIGEILHGSLGWESWGEVKRQFGAKDPQTDVGFALFPLYAVGRAWVCTLARFDEAGDGFNRNLTLHRIGFPYSEANLISVLLLLTGLLRGLQPALDRHDRREDEEAA